MKTQFLSVCFFPTITLERDYQLHNYQIQITWNLLCVLIGSMARRSSKMGAIGQSDHSWPKHTPSKHILHPFEWFIWPSIWKLHKIRKISFCKISENFKECLQRYTRSTQFAFMSWFVSNMQILLVDAIFNFANVISNGIAIST